MTTLDSDYYNQTCELKGGVFTYYSDLSGTGGVHPLTLLRSDLPPAPWNVNFLLKIVTSAPSGHTDVTGTVTVNAENVAFTSATTKYTVTPLNAVPTITVTDLDCNLVITAYKSSSDVYDYIPSACRWKDDAIIFMQSGGSFTQSKAVIITDAVYTVGQTLRKPGGTDTTGQLIKMITVQLNIDGVEEGRTYFI